MRKPHSRFTSQRVTRQTRSATTHSMMCGAGWCLLRQRVLLGVMLVQAACGNDGPVDPDGTVHPPALDTTPPEVTITTPLSQAVVADASFTVSGSLSDGVGVTRATYQVNGSV